MTTIQKSNLIRVIIQHLKFEASQATLGPKAFNEGDTFFALCFKSDKELQRIANLTGI